jgi:phage FluMu gp28-like protein
VFAEYAAEDFGKHAIMEVMLSQAWYRENMPLFVQAFEDQTIDLPRDADVRNDLRALERVDGIVKVPDLRMKDVKDADLMRHGDAAIALALAYVATLAHKAPVEFFAMKDGTAPDGFAWQRRAASDFSLTPEAIDWSLYD